MIKLELTQNEIQILAKGLIELPYKLSANLLQKLENAVQEELKNKQAEVKETV